MTLRVDTLGLTLSRPGLPPVTALDSVSFALERGEILGVSGSSGAGKSLVAAALAGALPRGAQPFGKITVDGARPGARDIALAPQRLDALDPLAPLGRQIRRLGGRRSDPRTELERVGLSAALTRAYPHMLSGGMARRALLATALARGADWLVADEPTVGLDASAADHVMALLGDLARERRGLVVISHDLPRLAGLADRILILRHGRPEEVAPAAAFAGDGSALTSPFARDLWRAQLPETAC
ncbi:peptide/nickel transport system ATP-binding protein [Tranquillimonas rosea]|uniref:Peptide/nickel transport system ATP-binding protein n=1 Tax=Tranquillimonas rosea TaxID=641238 RepID=A0A1H9X3G1_9RHOB|nr:ATP-binding cassette domain-containing protein [Tranquillimonas rosea]SES40571.1 peptide/nickel transport system ATP-binding protein [Tranquillimonas rosea]